MKRKRHSAGRQIRILAAVRISKASGRDVLSGMFRFFEENPNWQLHLVQYDSEFTADIVRRAAGEGFDGIVATFPGAAGTLEALGETGLPVVLAGVHASGAGKSRRSATFIENDNIAIGRLAASSFLRNGNYTAYAYVPKADEYWCAERGESFSATLAQSGKECSLFSSRTNPAAPVEDAEGLVGFLSDLPKPAAVYAASDECALKVLAAAHAAGIKVPQDISLIGWESCGVSENMMPPLTTIGQNFMALATTAIDTFEMIWNGKIPPLSQAVEYQFFERNSTVKAVK
jgi:LacI family transcriptional regulator